jgi:hypothetical protein
MKFEKGQSGNPGGRPKDLKEIQALAREKSPMALETLAQIASAGKTEPARVAAANAILDRAYGKAPQAVTGEGGEGPVLANITVTFVRPDAAS